MLGGRGLGHALLDFFDKNGAIWCNLGFPKYVITNLKKQFYGEKIDNNKT